MSNLDFLDAFPCFVPPTFKYYASLALPASVAAVFALFYGAGYACVWRRGWGAGGGRVAALRWKLKLVRSMIAVLGLLYSHLLATCAVPFLATRYGAVQVTNLARFLAKTLSARVCVLPSRVSFFPSLLHDLWFLRLTLALVPQ